MKKRLYHFILFISLSNILWAQQSGKRIELRFSTPNITQGDNFAIEANLHNINTNKAPTFPTIPGFKKLSVNQSTQTSIFNNRRSQTLTFTQYYKSTTKGKFKVPPFTISAGGTKTSHNGLTINVTGITIPKTGAYLSYQASKSKVYYGEPFQVSVYFFCPKDKVGIINMSQLPQDEIIEVRKQIKSSDVWSEEIDDLEYTIKEVEIKGKPFYKQLLGKKIVIPQKSKDLYFSPIKLDKTQQLAPFSRTFGGGIRGRREVETTFTSNALNIKVKALPSHSLKGKVPVGVFTLGEGIDRQKVKTGDNVIYSFEVKGKGNLPTLLEPYVKDTDSLLVLKESDKLSYSNKTGMIRGRKVFLYNIVPQISGEYSIKDFINFPYFNYEKGKYETLKSDLTITAKGENLIDTKIQTENNESNESQSTSQIVYEEGTYSENQRLLSIDSPEKQNLITNLLLLLLIGGLGYLMIKGNTK